MASPSRPPAPGAPWPALRDGFVWAMALAALVVRMPGLRRSLWSDEVWTVYQALLPLGDLLAKLRAVDIQPPGYLAGLGAWLDLAGATPLTVRLPSLLAGALTVLAMARLAARLRPGALLPRLAALAGALWAAGAHAAVEARPYAVLILLVTVSLEALLDLTGPRPRVRDGVVWALSLGAALWVHNIAWFVAAAEVLAGGARLLVRRRRPGAALVVGGLLAAALAVPRLVTTLEQYRGYRRGASLVEHSWKTVAKKVGGPGLQLVGGYFVANTSVSGAARQLREPANALRLAGVAAVWLVALGGLLRGPRPREEELVVAGVILATFAVAMGPLYFALTSRTMAAVGPALLLLLLCGILRAPGPAKGGALVALLAVNLATTVETVTAPVDVVHQEDLRAATASLSLRVGPGDLWTTTFPGARWMAEVYGTPALLRRLHTPRVATPGRELHLLANTAPNRVPSVEEELRERWEAAGWTFLREHRFGRDLVLLHFRAR